MTIVTERTSHHTISLLEGEIVEEFDLGFDRRRATADNPSDPARHVDQKRVVVNPGAMRTPHWHANTNELTYCVSGTALVSVLDIRAGEFSSFIINAGDMFHIDSGSSASHREHRARRRGVHHCVSPRAPRGFRR